MLINSQIALILKTSSSLMKKHDDSSLRMIHNIAFISLVENGCMTSSDGENMFIQIENDKFQLPIDYVCSFIGEDNFSTLQSAGNSQVVQYERTPDVVQPYRDILTGNTSLEEAIDFLETEVSKISEADTQDSVRDRIEALIEENEQLSKQLKQLEDLNTDLGKQLVEKDKVIASLQAEKEALKQSHQANLLSQKQDFEEAMNALSKQYEDQQRRIQNKHAAEMDKLRMQMLKDQKLGRKTLEVPNRKEFVQQSVQNQNSEPPVENTEIKQEPEPTPAIPDPVPSIEPTEAPSYIIEDLNDPPKIEEPIQKPAAPDLVEINPEDDIMSSMMSSKHLFPNADKIYRLSIDELTLNLSAVEIRDSYGNKVDSCEVITFPLSMKEETPKICSCLIRNQESEVKSSTPEWASVKHMCGNYPVFIKGTMSGHVFICSISLSKTLIKQGYKLNILKSRNFGHGGHLYLPDGNVHVHIVPVSQRNNDMNQADFIYAIEDAEGNIIECGDNSYDDGIVEVNVPSGRKRITCRWQDNVLYGDLLS